MSQGFQFGYQAPGFSLGVGAAVIEVCSQFCIGRIGGEDVPDDHNEGVGNGDGCFLLCCWVAVAPETQHEAVVAGAEPAVGVHRRPGRFNEEGLEVLVALAWGAVFAFARRFVVSGTQSGPGGQVRATGEYSPGLVPISDRIAAAATGPIPGIVTSRSRWRAKGIIMCSTCASSRAIMSSR